jgi:cyanophycin synthetase
MVKPAEAIEDALCIPVPTSDRLILDDCRRLTGPGLLWAHAGAVLDVYFHDLDTDAVIQHWREQTRRVLDAIGWPDENITQRRFEGGVNLAISAPMDQLYSATFAAKTAWHFCAAGLLAEEPGDFGPMIEDLQAVMAREANPGLIALIQAATARGLDVLGDDDEVSVGHGKGSLTWPTAVPPDPVGIDWSGLHHVPVALVTGTNGKTTTTRLSTAIAEAAGMVAGLTSTDLVRVGDDILDRGDYSGPGGARMLLRDRRLEMAYLEVARGGILRRGLPLRQARAAVVTNVAADHLGQYGVNTVAELAEAKFSVHRSLASDGVLVLNADDDVVVAEAARTEATICWFSLDPSNPAIAEAKANHQACAWLDDTSLVFFDGDEPKTIADVKDVPLTLGGAARYNIRNALAALCLSRAMGIPDQAIGAGLSGFQNNPRDNPGRSNEFAVGGARVFVDFAHNPHSISAVAEALAAIPAKRRFILLGHAGDRSDQDIRDVTQTAFSFNPDYVVATETPNYLRGRELGEVTALIHAECRLNGLPEGRIITAGSPTQGVTKIMELLRPGDLALLLVLSEREQVFEMLTQAALQHGSLKDETSR